MDRALLVCCHPVDVDLDLAFALETSHDETEFRHEEMMVLRYLNPPRRILGVVTLILACMFAAGWVRSVKVVDIVTAPAGRILVSGGQRWGLFRTGSFDLEAPIYFSGIRGVKLVRNDAPFPQPVWLTERETFVEVFSNDTDVSALYLIPYWAVVLPLTLVSAWLLFSKPRANKPLPEPRS